VTAARGRLAALLLAGPLLAGCASLPSAPAPAAAAVGAPAEPITGRLALHVAAHDGVAAQHHSSAFELHGDADAGGLRLTTPLGTTVAQARWQHGAVELATAEGPRHHASLDALTHELFGQSLPLAALFDWLRARPWPGAPSQPGEGGFSQLGWHIDTARHAEGWLLLRRAQPPALSVRVRLDGPR
jgi:outer membrane lipoprotein LolB